MNTLHEIEAAVAALTESQQKELLRHLEERFRDHKQPTQRLPLVPPSRDSITQEDIDDALARPDASVRPIAEIFEELSSQIPLEEWAELPTDGAEQHDHYLYGLPKRTNP